MPLDVPGAIMCFSTPSHDTLQTLHDIRENKNACNGSVSAACNIHKDENGGLSGIAYSVPDDTPIQALTGLTEDIFSGVSLVKCTDDFVDWDGDLDEIIREFNVKASTPPENHQGLAELVPLGAENDFFFEQQQAVFTGTIEDIELVKKDFDDKRINFRDLYQIEAGMSNVFKDRHFQDGAPWLSRLAGEVCILKAEKGSYLACKSGVPHIAGELIEAIRKDLSPSTTCGTFASSKELWFLENMAHRNRKRILARFAQRLGVVIEIEQDVYAHKKTPAHECIMAIEEYGCTHESLRLFENTKTVHHTKGCMPVTPWLGKIPIWLGNWQGVVLLSLRTNVAALGETALMPTINACRYGRGHKEEITTTQPNDIQVLHDYGQVALNMYQKGILTKKDFIGNYCLTATLHPHPLPVVLCPHYNLEWAPLLEPENKLYREGITTTNDAMQSGLIAVHMDDTVFFRIDTGSDGNGTKREFLQWNDSAISSLALCIGTSIDNIAYERLRPISRSFY